VREAIERVLHFFPTARQAEIQMRLSQSLRAVIAQRLVPSTNGGRVGALEILVHTPSIKQLLREGDIDGLQQAMEQDADEGCCTTDASLFALLCTGRIDEVEALRAAEDEPALRARIQRLREDQRAAATPLRLAPEVCVTAAAEAPARANARATR
jgi:twitching motility protein PilU